MRAIARWCRGGAACGDPQALPSFLIVRIHRRVEMNKRILPGARFAVAVVMIATF